VFLRNGFHTTNQLLALVDSGADFPIVHTDAAEELKVDLSNAPIRQFAGTTGTLQQGRVATISIIVLTDSGDRAFEISSSCVFCETFAFAAAMLLGQSGFFSHFRTAFHQPESFFEIEPWEEIRRHQKQE
jgi:hypothetical protein